MIPYNYYQKFIRTQVKETLDDHDDDEGSACAMDTFEYKYASIFIPS